MRTIVATLLLLAACHHPQGDNPGPGDHPDAGSCQPGHYRTMYSCVGDQAVYEGESIGVHGCLESSRQTMTCAQGCAVQGVVQELAPPAEGGLLNHLLIADLCAVAADGTVSGQAYLLCGTDGKCAASTGPTAPPPVACAAATLAQYGTVGARGVVADPLTERAA